MQINLLEYLEETVKNCPDKAAVIEGDNSITFQELYQRSKQLSCAITEKSGGTIRRPIAVYMKKSINLIAADLSIVYSGNAYMNLDVKNPETRIEAILKQIDPLMVITDDVYAAKLSVLLPEDRILNISKVDFQNICVDDKKLADLLWNVIDTDPLCIINTSGSTGTPKGVVLNHRSFIDFTDWANQTMKFSRDEVLGCLSPCVFDIYSYELCMLMSIGSTMVLLDESMAAFPARLLQTMQDRNVTFIFWVPTIMVNIANMGLLDKIKLPSIRNVWFAGEVFPTKQFNIWRQALSDARFVNMYGPIEITLDCTHYIVERELRDDEPIPIGYAMRNTDILLLNEQDELCKVGEEGELCVRGSSLAMGYYNAPEKTAAAFVQNPLNKSYPEIIYRTGDIAMMNERGEIMYKGRRDTLVKHSGYRIELSEIEHVVINTLKLASNGCVLYDYDQKQIILIYESELELNAQDLRRKIGEALPKYMVPTRYVYVREMPRNNNGKIDRLKLKEQLLG